MRYVTPFVIVRCARQSIFLPARCKGGLPRYARNDEFSGIVYIVGVVLLLLFLSSCSVHRLHQYDKSINAKLAQVGITISNGKEPYLIKKSFQNEFYLGGEDHYKARLYELYVNVSNSVGDWLIQTDSTILRKSLTVDINYSLKDLQTSKLLTSGSARSLIIFSESLSAWSSYVSSEKAYENAVNDAMRSVRMQVALYLAGQPKDKNEHKAKRH